MKNSLVSVSRRDMERENEDILMDSLAKLDPVLFRIRRTLIDNSINGELIPPIIEAMAQVDAGSGWGKVEIEIRDHKAVKCRGIDDRLLELELTFR